MIAYVLLVVCCAALSTGVPLSARELDCPFLPCPFPPCSNPQPTYYIHNGKNCTGCPQCPPGDFDPTLLGGVGKRQIAAPFRLCPIVDCAFLDVECPAGLVQGTFQVGGLTCPGCPHCPVTDGVGKRQIGAVLSVCPMVMCAAIEIDCPVATVLSTFHVGDQTCHGCPYCPVTGGVGKRQIGVFLHMCPMVLCAAIEIDCPVATVLSTFQEGSLTCQGCPYCPVTGGVGKRQITSIHMCPMVMCAFLDVQCPVGVVQGVFHVGGQTCPGCPYCPVTDVPTAPTSTGLATA